jgi:hypothetical protein
MPVSISPLEERRLLVGLAAVPPTVGALTFLAGPIAFRTGFSSVLPASASVSVAVAILATLVTVFCAAPSVFWMAKRRMLSLTRLIMLGAVLGNVPFTVIVLGVAVRYGDIRAVVAEISTASYGLSGVIERIALGACYGVLAAMLFWWISIRGTEMQRPRRKL